MNAKLDPRGRGADTAPGPGSVSPGPEKAPLVRPDETSLPANGQVVDYETHYRTHEVTPAQLLYDVRFLRQLNRMTEVEQALTAYLRYHGARAEPWMYLLLAVTYEVNGRSATSVKTALGWAAVLTRKFDDAFTLVEVADMLLVRGIDEISLPNQSTPIRTGDLLDAAQAKAPHRYEPILMSMLLAERTLDADRMAAAAENLLALGWPGYDELWRSETRRRVETLAAALERAGKKPEAEKLRNRLANAEPRDLLMRLTWEGDAGLELRVKEPLGAVASVAEPRTVFGGAIIKAGRGIHPESEYVCPLGFNGEYAASIDTIYNNPKDPARNVRLEVLFHEGSPGEKKATYELDPNAAEPTRVTLEGGRRKHVLPFNAPARLRVETMELEEAKETSRKGIQGRPASKGAQDAADALRVPSPGDTKTRPRIDLEPPARKP